MKLLLIAPQSPGTRRLKGKHVHHLNLALIAALAEPYFSEIKIVEEVFEELDLYQTADLVGITMMTCQAKRGFWLADHFRKRGIKTICGGSHASFMVEECLKHFDSAVVNEVELVWPDIMADLKTGRLKPVYHTDKIFDLKDMPVPRKDLFSRDNSTFNSQVIQASRGCPLGCNYCTVTKMYGKKYRTRPVEHVVEEIKRFPARIFFFVDDNIFLSKDYAYRLCEALIPLKIKWGSQGSLALIAQDERLLRLAKLSGCISLFVGIESIEQETLNSAHKGFNKVSEYDESIRKLHRAGINIIGAFMFGFEKDTPQVFDRVYDFVMRNRLSMISLGIVTPFPGTELYESHKKAGKIFDSNWDNYTGGNLVWNHPTMKKEEIKELYEDLRIKFYSLPSIVKRSWVNRFHPLYYLGMNLIHWRRTHNVLALRRLKRQNIADGSPSMG